MVNLAISISSDWIDYRKISIAEYQALYQALNYYNINLSDSEKNTPCIIGNSLQEYTYKMRVICSHSCEYLSKIKVICPYKKDALVSKT